MREDLIKSALSFLSDPKVQSAPLAKKVSFLESKGMTSEEIEEAMSRANGKAPTVSATTAANVPQGVMIQRPGMAVQHMPPPIPARPSYDWRDIFVAAVLAGGVGYGVWTLAKRLFGPWFAVPRQIELEEDKEKLDAQFQAVEDALNDIKDQTNTALTTVSSQSKKIDESLESLETVIKDLKEGEKQRNEEFKSVKSEVESLKDLVPKTLERNKDSQNSVLVDLQNEMKSLKSLLISRRGTSSVIDQVTSVSNTPVTPTTPTTPTTFTNTSTNVTSPTEGLSSRLAATINAGSNRAGIPAWQMASQSSSVNNTTTSLNNNDSKTEASGSSN